MLGILPFVSANKRHILKKKKNPDFNRNLNSPGLLRASQPQVLAQKAAWGSRGSTEKSGAMNLNAVKWWKKGKLSAALFEAE